MNIYLKLEGEFYECEGKGGNQFPVYSSVVDNL